MEELIALQTHVVAAAFFRQVAAPTFWCFPLEECSSLLVQLVGSVRDLFCWHLL